MSSLAELQEDLTTAKATRKKILTGVQEYTTRGQRIVYPTLKEINRLIEDLERDINRLKRPRLFQVDFGKMR